MPHYCSTLLQHTSATLPQHTILQHTFLCVAVASCSSVSRSCVALPSNDRATHRNTLQHAATHCNTPQHTVTHCDTLQHTATHCNTLQHTRSPLLSFGLRGVCGMAGRRTYSHAPIYTPKDIRGLLLCCSVLQCAVVLFGVSGLAGRSKYSNDRATRCNTLQHTATHCNTRKYSNDRAARCNTLQHTATHCNTRKYSNDRATRCNTLQHTAAQEKPPLIPWSTWCEWCGRDKKKLKRQCTLQLPHFTCK